MLSVCPPPGGGGGGVPQSSFQPLSQTLVPGPLGVCVCVLGGGSPRSGLMSPMGRGYPTRAVWVSRGMTFFFDDVYCSLLTEKRHREMTHTTL